MAQSAVQTALSDTGDICRQQKARYQMQHTISSLQADVGVLGQGSLLKSQPIFRLLIGIIECWGHGQKSNGCDIKP